MFEEYLIDCCSPTLAAMKSGSLFNCRCSCHLDATSCVRKWNRELFAYGVRMCVLRRRPESALILLFRPAQLMETLRQRDVQNFLSKYGYPLPEKTKYSDGDCQLYVYLHHLKDRIAQCDGFPHEIGIFLGYPLCDVQGFIENGGKNYKYLGPWKVYENETQTIQTFEKYKKCREVYTNLWASGKRSVLQLTVAG